MGLVDLIIGTGVFLFVILFLFSPLGLGWDITKPLVTKDTQYFNEKGFVKDKVHSLSNDEYTVILNNDTEYQTNYVVYSNLTVGNSYYFNMKNETFIINTDGYFFPDKNKPFINITIDSVNSV